MSHFTIVHVNNRKITRSIAEKFDRASCTSLEKKSSPVAMREINFHKYSRFGLGGGLFLVSLVLSWGSSGSWGNIWVLSVGSIGLMGCVARGANGAAPLLRDLLLRLRSISGPIGGAGVSVDVDVDGVGATSRSKSSRLVSRDRSPGWWWWCKWWGWTTEASELHCWPGEPDGWSFGSRRSVTNAGGSLLLKNQ